MFGKGEYILLGSAGFCLFHKIPVSRITAENFPEFYERSLVSAGFLPDFVHSLRKNSAFKSDNSRIFFSASRIWGKTIRLRGLHVYRKRTYRVYLPRPALLPEDGCQHEDTDAELRW